MTAEYNSGDDVPIAMNVAPATSTGTFNAKRKKKKMGKIVNYKIFIYINWTT